MLTDGYGYGSSLGGDADDSDGGTDVITVILTVVLNSAVCRCLSIFVINQFIHGYCANE